MHLHNVSNKKVLPGLFVSPYSAYCISLDEDKRPKKYDEISFVDGRDDNEVVDGLKTIVKNCKLKKVNLVVPESEVVTMFVVVKKTKRQSIRKTVAEYLQKEKQLDLKEIIFDFDVVSENNNILQISVILITKSKYDWYKKILSKLKVIPVRFISENISLATSLVEKGNGEPHIIVNVMPQYTTLSLVDNGIILKTEYINESLDISNTERLTKKINLFILEWYSEFGKVVHERAHHLIVNTYDQLLTKELVRSLKNKLRNINIKRENSWVNCFDLDSYIPDINKKDLYRFSVVIGASLFGRK